MRLRIEKRGYLWVAILGYQVLAANPSWHYALKFGLETLEKRSDYKGYGFGV